MKAAVLTSPQEVSKRPLRIVEVSKPELKPGHVLLRVLACGVCRTDLHIIEGELPSIRKDLVPGHQIVGELVDGATLSFLWARAWAFPGWAAQMESVGIAGEVSKIFAIRRPSQDTR